MSLTPSAPEIHPLTSPAAGTDSGRTVSDLAHVTGRAGGASEKSSLVNTLEDAFKAGAAKLSPQDRDVFNTIRESQLHATAALDVAGIERMSQITRQKRETYHETDAQISRELPAISKEAASEIRFSASHADLAAYDSLTKTQQAVIVLAEKAVATESQKALPTHAGRPQRALRSF